MTGDVAKRIVKAFLADKLLDGTFTDAIGTAGVQPEEAHELRNAAMAVAYELRCDAQVRAYGLVGALREVAGRAPA